MLDNDYFNFDLVPGTDILVAGMVALGGFAGGMFLLFAGGSRLANTKAFQNIALTDTQEKNKGYTANFVPEVAIGTSGVAYTLLRPGGKVQIGEKIYDAFTRGEFIEKGESVVVVDVEASTLKVKKS